MPYLAQSALTLMDWLDVHEADLLARGPLGGHEQGGQGRLRPSGAASISAVTSSTSPIAARDTRSGACHGFCQVEGFSPTLGEVDMYSVVAMDRHTLYPGNQSFSLCT